MRVLLDDLKRALRLYRRAPLQSAIAVAMIAVSTAFSLAFFSLYDNLVLWSPRGFEAPQQLVGVGFADDEESLLDVRLPGRLRRSIVELSRTIDSAAAVMYVETELATSDGSTMPATVAIVTEEFFEQLGVAMHLGRRLGSGAEAAEQVAVIDYGLWRDRFGGDAEAVGRHIEIGGGRFSIAGVTHPDFKGAHRGPGAVAWVPLSSFAATVWNASPQVMDDTFRMVTVARLAESQSPGNAAAEMRALSDRLRSRFPDDMLGLELTVLAHLTPDPRRHAYAARQIELMVATATLLAIVGAANLSLFFLARAPSRRREIAIRRSMGATGRRLARQLLTETSLLVATGVILGIMGALWLETVLRGLPFLAGVEWEAARSPGPTVAFIAVFALLLAATVGSAPAFDLLRNSLAERARQTPGRLATGQRFLLAAQIAVATLGLAVAALFADALIRASLADGGFDAGDVTVIRLARTAGEYPSADDASAVINFRRAITERLSVMDGIDQVGFGGAAPSVLGPDTYAVSPLGGFREEIASGVARLGADWMEVLRVRVLRGRLPDPEDARAAVVSRRFAESAWGTLDALGEQIIAPTHFSPAGGTGGTERLTVAAVVENIRFGNPAGLARPLVFVNQSMGSDVGNFVLVRGSAASGRMRELEAALDEVLAQMSPRMEIVRMQPLEDSLAALLAPDRARTALTGIAGALTALLAALGIFGALRFMVESGRFELALRSAHGAAPNHLRNHVVLRGLSLGLPGLFAGLILSGAALIHVRDAFGIYETDVLPALAACTALLGSLMCLAVGLPAVRASRVEPWIVMNER